MYTLCGWPEPLPSVDHLKARYEDACAQVDARYAEIVAAALTAEEAEELAAIAAAMSAAVSG